MLLDIEERRMKADEEARKEDRERDGKFMDLMSNMLKILMPPATGPGPSHWLQPTPYPHPPPTTIHGPLCPPALNFAPSVLYTPVPQQMSDDDDV